MKPLVELGVTQVAFAFVCVVATLVMTPRDESRLVAVEIMPRNDAEKAMALGLAIDVWSEHDTPIVVVLRSASLERLAGIPHRVVVEDVEAVARTERTRLARRTSTNWFAEYRDLAEIDEHVDRLAEEHPGLVRVRRLGSSIEERPIRAIEISRGGKLAIALDGGQHAREWVSVMVPLCIADRLATSNDPRIRRILDEVSFYIVPVVNPDGYHHSWTVDRYWRKNRRAGHGVDLNRNYSVAWGKAGSSKDPKSPNYRGEYPFSEPETRAMRQLFERVAIDAHVDFHAFSQLILYPWSHRREAPPDHERFAAIADRMSAAFMAAHGERYPVRAGSELTVGSSGTLGDWAYGERGVLSFLVELRPTSGREGFVLPPEQIVPTCEESLAGVFALAESLMEER